MKEMNEAYQQAIKADRKERFKYISEYVVRILLCIVAVAGTLFIAVTVINAVHGKQASQSVPTGWDMAEIAASNLYNRNRTYLYYDTDTNIVYVLSEDGGITPYIGENGRYCHYVDGNIVEAEE